MLSRPLIARLSPPSRRLAGTIAIALLTAPLLTMAIAPAQLLSDLWTGSGPEGGGAVTAVEAAQQISTANGGTYLYLDRDFTNQRSLWRWSPAGGATLLRSFRDSSAPPLPAPFDVSPYEPLQSVVIGGNLLFASAEGDARLGVDDSPAGIELWRSNGTSAGTQLVRDLYPGRNSSSPQGLVALTGRAYFVATSPDAQGRVTAGLWGSDGSESGTVLLRRFSSLTNPLVGGNRLYFQAIALDDGSSTPTPWTSDGTTSGTYPMDGVTPMPQFADAGTQLEAKGLYVFCAFDPANGTRKLFATDGSPHGLRLLYPVVEEPPSQRFDCLPNSRPVAFGDQLYFSADNGQDADAAPLRRGLWRTDGTAAGTRFVMAGGPLLAGAVVKDATLYFLLGENFREPVTTRADLWALPAGGSPAKLKTVGYPPFGSLFDTQTTARRGKLVVRNGAVYFFQLDCGNNDCGLWKTDGTAAGTVFDTADETLIPRRIGISTAASPRPRPVLADTGSQIDRIAVLPGHPAQAMFSGRYSSEAFENRIFLRTDGTAQGLTGLDGNGLRPSPGHDDARLGGRVLTDNTGDGDAYGDMSLVSYGSDGSRQVVKTFDHSDDGISFVPRRLTTIGNRVFFAMGSTRTGYEPWVSDGTAAGTHLIKELAAGADDGFRFDPGVVNDDYDGTILPRAGRAMFFGHGGSNDPRYSLWTSDGTATNTVSLKSLATGQLPRFLGTTAGLVFFSTVIDTDAERATEIWRSDGTVAGTIRLVRQEGFASPYDLHYFGGPNATQRTVMTLPAGGKLGNRLYFRMVSPAGGYELWSSDGSVAGTAQLADLNPGASGSYPQHFTALGAHLYFAATDAAHGEELWRTDGTAAGTVLVADIAEGLSSSSPAAFLTREADGRLLFRASSASTGMELWTTDGTAAGTALFSDIAAGASSSVPANLTALGARLLLTADDGVHGREPVTVAFPDPLTVTVADVRFDEGAASKPFTFRLNRAAARAEQVRWALLDGTATVADGDYTAASGTVTFPAGSTQQTIALAVNDDARPEPDETVLLQLQLPADSGLVLGTPQAKATLVNDDAGSATVMVMARNGQMVTVSTSDGLIEGARFDAPPAGAPADYDYPYGFLSMDVTRLAPGQGVTVTVTLPEAVGSYVKCMPSGCAPFSSGLVTGNRVLLTLQDGGTGDNDGIANGVIRDPGAPARVRPVSPTVPTPNPPPVERSSGGGGGGLSPGLLLFLLVPTLWRRVRRPSAGAVSSR